MNDEGVQSKSEETEVTPEVKGEDSASEQMIPKSRLDKVIEQREDALEQLETLKAKVEDIDTLKAQLEELKESVSNKNTNNDDTFTREEEDALSKIDKGLKAKGYLTKEELDERDRINNRNYEITRLADKYKKGSGFPEFKTDEVLVYAKKKGFGENLEAAYRDLHWDAITQVMSKGGGLEPVDSEKPVGGEREKGTQLTRGDIAEMELHDYEKSRSTIMDKFKKSIFGK